MNRIHLKSESRTAGFFYLDHQPTGKVYTDVSSNMQKTVLELKEELEGGRCKCKTLQRLWNTEPDFKATCVPTKGIREAQKLEKEFRRDREKFLLID